MHLYIGECDCDLYADDATAHTSGKSKTEDEIKLQNEGNNTKNCGKQNKMNIRYDKTTCMLLGTRYKTQNLEQMSVYINGNKIQSVSKQKTLKSIHR